VIDRVTRTFPNYRCTIVDREGNLYGFQPSSRLCGLCGIRILEIGYKSGGLVTINLFEGSFERIKEAICEEMR